MKAGPAAEGGLDGADQTVLIAEAEIGETEIRKNEKV